MASSAGLPTLSPEQQRAVDHQRGLLVVRGPARSGRTTAVVARWAHLVERGGDPARILVLCRDAGAARDLRRVLLQVTAGATPVAPVTSPWAWVHAAIEHHLPDLRLAAPATERALMEQILRDLGPHDLRHLSPAGLSEALVDELTDLATGADPARLATAGERAGAISAAHHDRWRAAAAAVAAHHAGLRERGLSGRAAALQQVMGLVESGLVACDTLVVDDVALADPVWGTPTALIEALAGRAAATVVTTSVGGPTPPFLAAAEVVELDRPRPDPGRHAVACHHPSIEGDAVAAIVLERLRGGVAPDDIVVVCRGRQRTGRVGRALHRHAVAAHMIRPPVGDDAHVRGLIGMLRWVAGDLGGRRDLLLSPLSGLDPDTRHDLRRSSTIDSAHPGLASLVAARDRLATLAAEADVARVAHEAFTLLARDLVPTPGPAADPVAERALDACVAFVDDLLDQVAVQPDLRLAAWVAATATDDRPGARPPAPAPAGAVLVAAPDDLRGRAWPVVIITGMVEGELPRISADVRYLDRALLGTGPAPAAAARRAAALVSERALFDDVVRRAEREVVAVAPLEPGVLMSRLVLDWDCRAAELAPPAPVQLAELAPTTNHRPLHPGGVLQLSASQLDTYAECGLRYLYEYPLRVRGDANIWAGFGTLVHDILEEFVGPDADETDLSWARLVRLAEDHWRDDIAQYRPQREELRRDLFELLQDWWQAEGSRIGDTLEVLGAEREFTIAVGDHTVTGRIDRIDRADDGEGLRILDYKTSKQAKPVDDMAGDLQLRLYHLAARRDPTLAALGPPRQLRLLFLRGMKARDQEITADHEQTTVALVEAMAADILAQRFEPSAGEHCRRCAVKRLCPLWPEGREAPLRS